MDHRIARPMGRSGFTLVEILVVLVIVALITGSALLAFGLIGGGGAARDVERLEARLLAARERAELENRDYGVRLRADGYEFMVFDPTTRRWLSTSDRAFARVQWSLPLLVELDVDGRRIVLRGEDDSGRNGDVKENAVPDFGVDPSGEFTSFELRLTDIEGRTRYRLGLDDAGDLRREERAAS